MRLFKSHPLLKIVNSYTVDSAQPSNISYAWNFGSLLAFCLIIQIATGVTLAMHYNPSVIEAFNSVEHIMRDVNNGWLIRYLHSNTASAFFFLVYLHIGRGLYYGSYKAPRTLVWTIGTVIFILMMATAFLGYVLPYGQMSLWGATVITNLMSAIPWIGQDIVEFIWGGFSVSNATLNRFFSLHFVLPFILAALALMHLITLHDSAGSGNPLGISGNCDRLPFAPYFIFKDLITIFIFILALSILVFFMPNVLGDSENYVMANPMQTPPAIVPEWYLLPFYAILRSIPNKLLGVITMFAAIVILLAMPFVDLSRSRGIQFRPISKIMFFVFIVNFLLLLTLGSKHVESPFIEFGQISTLFYFLYFLLIIPMVSILENSLIQLKLARYDVRHTETSSVFENFSLPKFDFGFLQNIHVPGIRVVKSLVLGQHVKYIYILFEKVIQFIYDVHKKSKSWGYSAICKTLFFCTFITYTMEFKTNNYLLSDAPRPWGIYFQDSGTPQMEGLVELHDDILFYLVIILFAVGWIIMSILNINKNSSTVISNKYIGHGTFVELVWTITPALILILIAFPSFKLLYLMDEVSDPAMAVLAEGHQWYWSYQYPDFVNSDMEFIEYDSYLIPESDLEEGALRMLEVDNRILLPELTHVRFIVTAADVIHSFACPSLGIKCDAYPGRLNQVSVMFNRAGTFYGQCSEICGILHSSMPITIECTDINKFVSWLTLSSLFIKVKRASIKNKACVENKTHIHTLSDTISTIGGICDDYYITDVKKAVQYYSDCFDNAVYSAYGETNKFIKTACVHSADYFSSRENILFILTSTIFACGFLYLGYNIYANYNFVNYNRTYMYDGHTVLDYFGPFSLKSEICKISDSIRPFCVDFQLPASSQNVPPHLSGTAAHLRQICQQAHTCLESNLEPLREWCNRVSVPRFFLERVVLFYTVSMIHLHNLIVSINIDNYYDVNLGLGLVLRTLNVVSFNYNIATDINHIGMHLGDLFQNFPPDVPWVYLN